MGFFDALFGSGNAKKKANCKADVSLEKDLSKVQSFNEEFSTDLPSEVRNDDIISCSRNGVQMQNLPGMLKLTYDGTLAKSDAQDIYAVVGYGDNSNWEETGYYPMQKTANQNFEVLTFRKKPGEVNIAFKDSAGNWDNNSGKNYIFYTDSVEGSQ